MSVATLARPQLASPLLAQLQTPTTWRATLHAAVAEALAPHVCTAEVVTEAAAALLAALHPTPLAGPTRWVDFSATHPLPYWTFDCAGRVLVLVREPALEQWRVFDHTPAAGPVRQSAEVPTLRRGVAR